MVATRLEPWCISYLPPCLLHKLISCQPVHKPPTFLPLPHPGTKVSRYGRRGHITSALNVPYAHSRMLALHESLSYLRTHLPTHILTNLSRCHTPLSRTLIRAASSTRSHDS